LHKFLVKELCYQKSYPPIFVPVFADKKASSLKKVFAYSCTCLDTFGQKSVHSLVFWAKRSSLHLPISCEKITTKSLNDFKTH